MLIGLLLWGGMYTAFALIFPHLSTPEGRLPGYFMFEVFCLFPWTVWLLCIAVKKGGATGISVLVQAFVVMAVTYPIHIAATHSNYWAYFQERDVLLGIRIAGVPIEEYFFYPIIISFAILCYLWFCQYMKSQRLSDLAVRRKTLRLILGSLSAIFFCLGLYVLTLRDPGQIVAATQTWDGMGVPHYAEGPRVYGWTLVCLFSVSFNLWLLYLAERFTPMMLRAVLPVIVIFFVVCLLVDLIGVSRGWWVFNAQQVSGWWVGGTLPLENLPSYVTGVTLSIAVFEGTRRLLGAKGLP